MDPLQRRPRPVAASRAVSAVSHAWLVTCRANPGWHADIIWDESELCSAFRLYDHGTPLQPFLPDFTILYRCTKTSLTRIPGATHLPNGRWKSRMWPGELNRPFISLHCGPVSPSAGQQMGMRMQLKHNPNMSRWYLPEQNRQPAHRGVSQHDGSKETHRNKPIKLLLNIVQTVNYVYLYITSD